MQSVLVMRFEYCEKMEKISLLELRIIQACLRACYKISFQSKTIHPLGSGLLIPTPIQSSWTTGTGTEHLQTASPEIFVVVAYLVFCLFGRT